MYYLWAFIVSFTLVSAGTYFSFLFAINKLDPNFLKIDSCLDRGGRWDYAVGRCGLELENISKPSIGEQKENLCASYPVDLDAYLPNKKFMNFGASGEKGTFNQNGTLSVEWGRDYVPNDTRPNKATAQWEINNNRLILSGTSLSDKSYDCLTFVEYEGILLAEEYIIIGSSFEIIEKYFKSTLH